MKQQGSTNGLPTSSMSNPFNDKYVTIGDLPESVRILAMKRCIDYRGDLETIKDLMDQPIRKAFSFSDAPEGAAFWMSVCKGTVNFDDIKIEKPIIKLGLNI